MILKIEVNQTDQQERTDYLLLSNFIVIELYDDSLRLVDINGDKWIYDFDCISNLIYVLVTLENFTNNINIKLN